MKSVFLRSHIHRSLALAVLTFAAILLASVASAEAGRVWEKTSFPAIQSEVGRIVAHPTDPNTIYVPTTHTPNPIGGALPPADGVWRTVDGGDTWQSISDGVLLPEYNVAELAICRDAPQVMYAATLMQGIFKSVDGGQTWSDINAGFSYGVLGFPNPNWGVLSVAVDPGNPNDVYMSVAQIAGIDPMNPSIDHPGFFYSTDGGTTWIENNSGLPNRIDDASDGQSRTAVASSIVVVPQKTRFILLGMLDTHINLELFAGRTASTDGRVFVNGQSGTTGFVEVSSGLPSGIAQTPTVPLSIVRISTSALVLKVGTGSQPEIWASHLGLTLDSGFNGDTLVVTRNKGLSYTTNGNWAARNTGLPYIASWTDPASTAMNTIRYEDTVPTSGIALGPGSFSRVGIVGSLRSDQGDASSNATKVYATDDRGLPTWRKNWDSGLDTSPTLGYSEANASSLVFNANLTRAFAAVAWTDAVVTNPQTDDNGVYRLTVR